MKTKKVKKLALSRETLHTLEAHQMKNRVVGASGCPSCETCEVSCGGWSCYTCDVSCGGSCHTCEASCPCI